MPLPPHSAIPRHFGLDWLRIGAFGLLIAFHIGVYFAPGHWIVKSPEPVEWLVWPLAAIVPWRLSLLFAISGYATAAMMQRFPNLTLFLADRSKRLLVPLLFGALVIVPPQDWVRLEVSGSHDSYWHYLLTEHFAFRVRAGTFLPAWEHLWFLAYLATYTAVVALFVAAVPRWRETMRAGAATMAPGLRLLWLPPAAMLVISLLMIGAGYADLSRHAEYLPPFVAGFGYAHSASLRAAFARLVRPALTVSALSLAVIWWVTGSTFEPAWVVELAAGTAMSWTMLPVLFALAERALNFDHPWRSPLAASVFPAYLVHQTLIVIAGWYLAQAGVVGAPAFVILLLLVVGGCWLTWRLAKGSPAIGLLFGMPHRASAVLTPPRTIRPAVQ